MIGFVMEGPHIPDDFLTVTVALWDQVTTITIQLYLNLSST
jgi:hypothetical protein